MAASLPRPRTAVVINPRIIDVNTAVDIYVELSDTVPGDQEATNSVTSQVARNGEDSDSTSTDHIEAPSWEGLQSPQEEISTIRTERYQSKSGKSGQSLLRRNGSRTISSNPTKDWKETTNSSLKEQAVHLNQQNLTLMAAGRIEISESPQNASLSSKLRKSASPKNERSVSLQLLYVQGEKDTTQTSEQSNVSTTQSLRKSPQHTGKQTAAKSPREQSRRMPLNSRQKQTSVNLGYSSAEKKTIRSKTAIIKKTYQPSSAESSTQPPVVEVGKPSIHKNPQHTSKPVDFIAEKSHNRIAVKTAAKNNLKVSFQQAPRGTIAIRTTVSDTRSKSQPNLKSEITHESDTVLLNQLCVCYICGQEFRSKSISIHESKCLVKWKLENNRLPKIKRKPLPQRPSINSSAEEQNMEVFDSRSKLFLCKGCGHRVAANQPLAHEHTCKKVSVAF